jgi:hypothetical protein
MQAAAAGTSEEEAIRFGKNMAGLVDKLVSLDPKVNGSLLLSIGNLCHGSSANKAEAIAKETFRQSHGDFVKIMEHISEIGTAAINISSGEQDKTRIESLRNIESRVSAEAKGQTVKDVPPPPEPESRPISSRPRDSPQRVGFDTYEHSNRRFRYTKISDLDPNLEVQDASGRLQTNIELMLEGKAPYVSSGERVRLAFQGTGVFTKFMEVIEGSDNGIPEGFDVAAYWIRRAESFGLIAKSLSQKRR